LTWDELQSGPEGLHIANRPEAIGSPTPPPLPLPTSELWAKFQECAQLVHATEDRARRLFDALQRIDALNGPEDIPEVT